MALVARNRVLQDIIRIHNLDLTPPPAPPAPPAVPAPAPPAPAPPAPAPAIPKAPSPPAPAPAAPRDPPDDDRPPDGGPPPAGSPVAAASAAAPAARPEPTPSATPEPVSSARPAITYSDMLDRLVREGATSTVQDAYRRWISGRPQPVPRLPEPLPMIPQAPAVPPLSLAGQQGSPSGLPARLTGERAASLDQGSVSLGALATSRSKS